MAATRPMRRHRAAVMALITVVGLGCATDPDVAEPDAPGATEPSAPPEATDEPVPPEARPGAGRLMMDDQLIEVRGDCDLSRTFGQEPVTDLDTDVELLLDVRDAPDQPFAVRALLVGGGSVLGRMLVIVGGADADPTNPPTWEGTVTEAELDAHPSGEPGTVVLRLLAVARSGEDALPQARLEVDCAVTQPG